MPRPDAIRWLPTGIAALGSAVAWTDWLGSQEPASLALAFVMQAVAGLVLAGIAPPGRRLLIALVAVSVPVVGPIASLYIEGERGRGGAELLADPDPMPERIDGVAIAQHLTAALPPCEAIVSGDAEARRAMISRLSQRAGREDVEILRWARKQPDAEVAVEAALALADLEQQLERRLREARGAVADRPSFETHAALVSAICDGVLAGIVDAPLVSRLVAEARRHHIQAVAADPVAAQDLALACGRLELAARRPDFALAIAKRALARSADPALVQLYTEAAYAARRFDLVPGLRQREADVRAA